jgi:uncharacterized protein (TIGR02145 family)
MKQFPLITLLAISLALFLSCFNHEDDPEPIAEIYIQGTVKDAATGEPIAGAEVTLFFDERTLQKTKTNGDGVFSFPVSQDGNYQFIVQATGYKDAEKSFPLTDLSNNDMDIKMTAASFLTITNESSYDIDNVRWSNGNASFGSIRIAGSVEMPVNAGSGYVFFTRSNDRLNVHTEYVAVSQGERKKYIVADTTIVVEIAYGENRKTLGEIRTANPNPILPSSSSVAPSSSSAAVSKLSSSSSVPSSSSSASQSSSSQASSTSASSSSIDVSSTRCRDGQGFSYFCEWGSRAAYPSENPGCFAIDPAYSNSPAQTTCYSLFAECYAYGYLYLNSTSEGKGTKCNGTRLTSIPSSSSAIVSSSSSVPSSSSLALSSSSSSSSMSSSSSPILCNGATYDSAIEFCYNNQVTPKCENKIYNTSQFCHEDKIYSRCGTAEYNPSTEFCQSGTNAVKGKCGGAEYAANQFCFGSEPYYKCGSSSSGAEYDPTSEVCCGINKFELLSDKFCYGTNIYPKCNGETYKASTEACCDKGIYSLATHFCYENSTIASLCGSNPQTSYNPNLYECSGSHIMLKGGAVKSGKTYSAVLIGTQTWITTNLDSVSWAATMDLLIAKCNSNSCSEDILTPHQGICPDGWHIPSDAEWTTLIDYVKTPMALAANEGSYSYGWPGLNTYGFSARHSTTSTGNYYTNHYGQWWSATESSATAAKVLSLSWTNNASYGSTGMSVSSSNKDQTKKVGVRCLMD